MLPVWLIFASALIYMLFLFWIANRGDRKALARPAASHGRPVIYALSLAIYCTSWTYFGAVGLAAERGLEFIAIYIGPILMFTLGLPIIRRIIELAKAEKLTSIADFIGARYGKNPFVAGIVALIAVIGVIPYVALQLKAVSESVTVVVNAADSAGTGLGGLIFSDISLLVTIGLAIFAIMFGTRHTDATEHQDGLILAVAAESVVKLLAFVTAGLFVTFSIFGGIDGLMREITAGASAGAVVSHTTPFAKWLTLIVLSAFAIILLPRQFHVAVVENRSNSELRMAAILFPAYLIIINLFVIPVAIGGVVALGADYDADLYLLLLPLMHEAHFVTLLTFLGGFSAATAMVIVASVAVSIMISNDLVMPLILRRHVSRRRKQIRDDSTSRDYTAIILRVRRTAIFVVLLLGYGYYLMADINANLAQIGLLSFVAVAQFAPALFGGLIWRQANARGALCGLMAGITAWAVLLFIPSLAGIDNAWLGREILAFALPGNHIFSAENADPLVNATLISLALNTLFFIGGSLTRASLPRERMQADIFIARRPLLPLKPARWTTQVTVGDIEQTIGSYLGADRTTRSIRSFEADTGRRLIASEPADINLVRHAEQLLGSAIGSASARLVLGLLFQRIDDRPIDTARLLDEASEALQYNRDILRTALGQLDQGITVFDGRKRLTLWNRQFRQLLDLPESVGEVGYRFDDILTIMIRRGDLAETDRDAIHARFSAMDQPFALKVKGAKRIIEIRSNPMPENGVVTTYADITERVASNQALKLSNETLEQRVSERTAELTAVNRELAKARAAADAANLGKTRFLAAAGHDILQPLNAARLYCSSLLERLDDKDNSALARNINSSLDSVESILGAVLDLSRLDTGIMKPQITSFELNELLSRIETDFAPLAAEKGLGFKVLKTSAYIRSDQNLLRRLVQNLVSNAIKYTQSGRILVGVRRRGKNVCIEVTDTGIGISSANFKTVFREFTRLDEGARTASGLGLGLSIVDRIAKVLNHKVLLNSIPGKGTDFRVEVPVETNVRRLDKLRQKPLPARAAAPSSLGGLRLLCIDNEPNILEGMQLLLAGWGCEVMTCRSLKAVHDLLQTDAPCPDVIIADYHLDDGVGIEAIDLVRDHFQEQIEALLVSADRSQEVRNEAEARSVSLHNKPIKPAALRAWLNQIAPGQVNAAE